MKKSQSGVEEAEFGEDQGAAPAPDRKLSAYKDSYHSDSDELEDDNDRAYADPKRKRDPGTGPIRLGTILELNEGQYSLLFVASMHSDYIYYYTEVHGKEEEVLEKIKTEKLKEKLCNPSLIQQEKNVNETSNMTYNVPKEAADTPIKESELITV